jgi:3-(methylsulfanyl)propanoyl-CoA dehydrogenase
MLYEGTNGIQALDLVGRKMPAHTGRYLRRFFHPVSDLIAECKKDTKTARMAEALERAFGALQLATAQIARTALKDAEEAGAAASDYLRLMGLVGMGAMWLRSAAIAHAKIDAAGVDAGFYRAKLVSAQFFMDRILPQSTALFLAIKSGKDSIMALEETAF